MDEGSQNRIAIDCEFLQNLCNASYLQYLAQGRYFEDEAFMKYLSYLRYWNQPEFKRLLIFPQSLEILDNLLSNETFRKELLIPQFVAYFHQQQGSNWMLDKTETPLLDQSEIADFIASTTEKK
jgi:mediator of RNA polymerase II transcription subunit 31